MRGLIAFIFASIGFALLFWFGGMFVYTDALEKSQMVQIGTVQDVQTDSSFFSNTTTLRISDGTVVTLSGKLNPWKTGEAVSKPAVNAEKDVDSDSTVKRLKKTWCVGVTCLEEN